MKKDARIFIEHILDCIKLIEGYLHGKSKSDFLESSQLQDAVIRRIEIIGEAAKNIPEEIKSRYPDIAWSQITGMRDILTHKYFGIDLELTWEVIANDIPKLKDRMMSIRRECE